MIYKLRVGLTLRSLVSMLGELAGNLADDLALNKLMMPKLQFSGENCSRSLPSHIKYFRTGDVLGLCFWQLCHVTGMPAYFLVANPNIL